MALSIVQNRVKVGPDESTQVIQERRELVSSLKRLCFVLVPIPTSRYRVGVLTPLVLVVTYGLEQIPSIRERLDKFICGRSEA